MLTKCGGVKSSIIDEGEIGNIFWKMNLKGGAYSGGGRLGKKWPFGGRLFGPGRLFGRGRLFGKIRYINQRAKDLYERWHSKNNVK